MGPPTAPLVESPPPPTTASPPVVPTTLLGLIDEILEVQKQRALAYTIFNNGFKSYLNNGAEGPYRHLMQSLTAEFQSLSQRILAVETTLRDHFNSPDIANLCRTVQTAERRKLELTLTMQAMRSAVEQGRFEWQHGDHGVGAEGADGDHVHGHGNGHSCGACGGSSADVTSEPTEAEIKGASKEGTREMDKCVELINEAIAELQELRAEALLETEEAK